MGKCGVLAHTYNSSTWWLRQEDHGKCLKNGERVHTHAHTHMGVVVEVLTWTHGEGQTERRPREGYEVGEDRGQGPRVLGSRVGYSSNPVCVFHMLPWFLLYNLPFDLRNLGDQIAAA